MIIVHDVAMGDVIITNWTNVIQTKKNFPKIKRFQIIIFHILQGKLGETQLQIGLLSDELPSYAINHHAMTVLIIDSLWIWYVISSLKSLWKSHNRIHFYFNGGLSWTHKNTQ